MVTKAHARSEDIDDVPRGYQRTVCGMAEQMVADQVWVSVEIKRGSVVLVSPTVYQTTNEETFGSLLGQVGSGTSDQHLEP